MRGPAPFSTYAANVRLPANGFVDRDYPALTEVWTAEIHPHVSYFRTAGFRRPGDGGGALYVRVAEEPRETPLQARGQSADGAWWQLAEASVDLRMLGARDDASEDSTAIAQAAIDSYDDITIGRGTYLVSSITVSDRKTIRTEGIATVLRQIANVPPGTCCLAVTGSDVVIGDLQIIGNIATDTGEQNHGLLIRGDRDIGNVRIGNIVGQDIRGDAVIVAGLATAKARNIVIGDVYGRNILRNVVSVTGGENIAIGHIEAESCGLYTLDLEPNPNSQAIRAVSVRSVRGASIGLVGLNAQQFVETVDIGFLDLDPGHTSDSSPPYGFRAITVKHGIHARNARDLRVRNFRARNIGHQPFFYIYNGGELVGEDFVFDRIDIADCGSEETVYNALFQSAGVRRISIGGGSAILSEPRKFILFGGSDSDIATTPDLTVTTNGQVAYGCTGGRYRVVIDSSASLNLIGAARVATTAAGVLAGDFVQGAVVDDVTLRATDVVLIKDQADPLENGYYRINAAGAPTRLLAAGEGYLNGYVVVADGAANAGKRFRCVNDVVPRMGKDGIVFGELMDFDVYAFVNCAGGLVESSRIKLGRLTLASTHFTFMNTEALCATHLFGTDSDNHVAVNTTLNGDYYALGPVKR